MKRIIRAIGTIVGLAAISSSVAIAGEITACISPAAAKGCNATPVLQNVPLKSVILEFIDPQHTGLGESVGRLLWREVLFGIGDMRGAGVILGTDREGQLSQRFGKSSTDVLDQRFHDAAVEIADFLHTQMSVWGAVVSEGDGNAISVYMFLTTIPTYWKRTLGISISSEVLGAGVVAAPLSETNFNFAPVATTPKDLIAGRVRVRCALKAGCPSGVEIYREPRDGAAVAGHIPEGQHVQVRDMSGKWLTVAEPTGGDVYLNIYHADIAPRAVLSREARTVRLRNLPGGPQTGAAVQLYGQYPVLEMDRTGADIAWYKITTPQGQGWIPADSAEALYRFPITYFLLGLYRYAAGNFERSEQEFTNYLDAAGADGDRITRSSALQLIAASRASRAFGLTRAGPRARPDDALAPLKDAQALTPYDPAIYNMQALVRLAAYRNLAAALPDLTRAVGLERSNAATQSLVGALNSYNLGRLNITTDSSSRQQLEALRTNPAP